jgi:FMN phosphatase YigB (HAD superfamily)
MAGGGALSEGTMASLFSADHARARLDDARVARQVAPPFDLVFLLDVDNTLLDNDAVERDLRRHTEAAFGRACHERFWQIFEQQRAELGYADYLGALQRYRIEQPLEPHLIELSLFLIDYPFTDRLYPQAIDLVRRLRRLGMTVILSDGDVVFQPHKVARSGLLDAVDGHALIYIHKEQMLDDVERRYPARHYVMVDDKLRILAAMKAAWGPRLTTVFVRQGHYAHDRTLLAAYPAADVAIDEIGEWDPGSLPPPPAASGGTPCE